jgi:hypothetical protein
MVRAKVNPGICGMTTTVEVCEQSKRVMRFEVKSDCKRATAINKLSPVSLHDILRPPANSTIYLFATKSGVCASCPIPMAILKAIEIEAKVALPRPVDIDFETIADVNPKS